MYVYTAALGCEDVCVGRWEGGRCCSVLGTEVKTLAFQSGFQSLRKIVMVVVVGI